MNGATRARSPGPTGAPDVTRAGGWDVVLTGLTVTIGAQVVRVLFPLAYGFGETTSFLTAGLLAVSVSLAPLLTPLLMRAAGPDVALTASVAAVVVLRFAMQVVRPIPLWLAGIATAASFVAWTVLFVRAAGAGGAGHRFTIAVTAGLSLDVALRSGFWTWDYAWQAGLGPLVLCLLLSGATLVSATRVIRAKTRIRGLPGVAAACLIGPFLLLHFLVLHSPAFAASATGLSLPAATIVILLADVLALGVVVRVSNHPPGRGLRLVFGGALVAVTLGFTSVDEPIVVGAVLAGGPLAGGLLALSLNRIRSTDPTNASLWLSGAAFGAATCLFFASILLYQIHYDMPLPFPNSVLFQIAAASFAFGALRESPPRRMQIWAASAAIVPIVLAAVPVTLLFTSSGPDLRAPSDTFRLVNYNIHSAVNGDGQLDPEGIARVIEEQRPDVVTLQEVSRGWAIGGTTDLAEWLSHRLRMRYVYAPAADGQFGNVVLSRLPIATSERVYLPKGAGPMRRSYARAEVDLGNGQSVDVISVHLQHRAQNTNTRLTQIAVLIDTWERARPAVLAGDLNAEPGSPEVAEFEDLGLVSAQDVTGHEELATSPSRAPRVRIDWIFGTNDVGFADFSIPRSTASDHLPLAVDVTIRR
jgi:endonuclease/exonuclease/phosphatase family metal-dependent hydrolase